MEYLPCTFKALSSFPAPQETEEKSKLSEELRYGCNVPAKGSILVSIRVNEDPIGFTALGPWWSTRPVGRNSGVGYQLVWRWRWLSEVWCLGCYRQMLSLWVPLLCSHSSVVMLEIDNRLCLQSPENDHCFPDAQSAADYLGALSAVERLDFPYPLRDVRGEAGGSEEHQSM